MIEAYIFDVDGVLVDSPHERAWGDTLRYLIENEWTDLVGKTSYSPERYTSSVYQEHVAGRPRHEGAAALLDCFGIPDPDGSRLRMLCDRKQEMIERLIDNREFTAFEDALHFVVKAKMRGARVAAASSSKNANRLMSGVELFHFCVRNRLICDFVHPETALVDLFDANVCGMQFERGKPHPEIFLSAAAQLGAKPERCVVIEDAPSGVQAAKAGGMRCIAVARNGDGDSLRSAGADWVVTSLDEVEP